MVFRVAAGAMCLFVSALLIAFLADAKWSALGTHPARIVIAGVMILITVALVVSGVRLLRVRKNAP
jgi:hypothetical protein